jgi:catechol 2,3-dioxygenase-like lactoylglutathione lyase family enzyme
LRKTPTSRADTTGIRGVSVTLVDVLNSVELVLVTVPEPDVAVRFYVERLGFRCVDSDPDAATLQLGALQLVLQRGPVPDTGGSPRIHIRVPRATLEAVWSEDRRVRPGVAGPRLVAGAIFEYETRDPAGNLVRLKTPVAAPPARER